MLYKLANQEGGFIPAKYFSIDRVFRNETLDATHLAEFHQVEGVVADRNLTLGDLIGVIAEFFKKLGISQIEFKPAYNPYTEPSMEIFCFHPGLKKWIEVNLFSTQQPYFKTNPISKRLLHKRNIAEIVNHFAFSYV